MSPLVRWVIFIPFTIVVYKICTIVVYAGVSFLYYFLSQLPWYFFILALIPVSALLTLITGGLWQCFWTGLYLSPNRALCWLLTLWLVFSSFSSITGYCIPIPSSPNSIIIQLPCWAYVTLQIYVVASLVFAAFVVDKGKRASK